MTGIGYAQEIAESLGNYAKELKKPYGDVNRAVYEIRVRCTEIKKKYVDLEYEVQEVLDYLENFENKKIGKKALREKVIEFAKCVTDYFRMLGI